MREMYRREKRRIRFERWSWLSVSWGLYAMTLLGQAPSPYSPDYKEIQNMILDFEAGALIFLGIFLLLSVNDTLFFIREQGKKVYLLEKYVIVPIHKKKLYEVWVRIFLETILYYIIGASCIYAIMTIANNCIFSPAVLCFGAGENIQLFRRSKGAWRSDYSDAFLYCVFGFVSGTPASKKIEGRNLSEFLRFSWRET